jgi:hypothetical protein
LLTTLVKITTLSAPRKLAAPHNPFYRFSAEKALSFQKTLRLPYPVQCRQYLPKELPMENISAAVTVATTLFQEAPLMDNRTVFQAKNKNPALVGL